MNSIDKLIALASLRGSLDLRCQFQGDWALDHPADRRGLAPYHIVLTGTCHAELSGGQRVRLNAGDVLLLPGGSTHLLRSEGARIAPSVPRVIAGGLLPMHRMGCDEPEVDMLCGSFHYNPQSLLFSALPEYLVISSRESQVDAQLVALIALRLPQLADLLRAATHTVRQRCTLFVVSDFISEPGWEQPLGELARRHDVVAVRLLDPLELNLPDLGLVTVRDAETGEQLLVDTHDSGFRQRFARIAAQREAQLRESLTRAGVDTLELATDDDLADAVLRFVDMRKRRAQPRRPLPAHLGARA